MFSFLLYPRKEGWGSLWWEIGGVGMRRRGGGARDGAGEMQGWIKERESGEKKYIEVGIRWERVNWDCKKIGI